MTVPVSETEKAWHATPITVSFTASPTALSDLIAVASTLLELDRYDHDDLPLGLWHLLGNVHDILRYADHEDSSWRAHEWWRRVEDWHAVAGYCETITRMIWELLPRGGVPDD